MLLCCVASPSFSPQTMMTRSFSCLANNPPTSETFACREYGFGGRQVYLGILYTWTTSIKLSPPSHDAVQEVLAMLTTSSRLQTLTIGFQSTTRHSPSSWSTRNTIQFVPLSSLKKLTLRFLRGDFRRELLVLVRGSNFQS